MENKIVWIIIFLAAYPVIISLVMPIINKNRMNKQEQLRDEYLLTMKKEDKIVTISGIYGTIKNIDNNIVKLEIAKNVEIEIDKGSIMGALK